MRLSPIIIYEVENKVEDHFFDFYIEILKHREIDIEKDVFDLNKKGVKLDTLYNSPVLYNSEIAI